MAQAGIMACAGAQPATGGVTPGGVRSPWIVFARALENVTWAIVALGAVMTCYTEYSRRILSIDYLDFLKVQVRGSTYTV